MRQVSHVYRCRPELFRTTPWRSVYFIFQKKTWSACTMYTSFQIWVVRGPRKLDASTALSELDVPIRQFLQRRSENLDPNLFATLLSSPQSAPFARRPEMFGSLFGLAEVSVLLLLNEPLWMSLGNSGSSSACLPPLETSG
jgi:hypothetical protein